MAILFFDTETTGKPVNYNGAMADLDNWPRVIQLAWIVADSYGVELCRHSYLIKPDGWVIPQEKFWIDNGFSTETNTEKGIPMESAVEIFLQTISDHRVDTLVAHNIKFDYNVFGAELLRLNTGSEFMTLQQCCTMDASTNFCQIPGRYGFKWPTLTELHNKLFGCGFDGAHDALADVAACMRCYFSLGFRNIIAIPAPNPTTEEIADWRNKAAKWEALDKRISKCYLNKEGEYDEDNPEIEDADLCTIGEMAATAFGYL